jgi:hypothetical protein
MNHVEIKGSTKERREIAQKTIDWFLRKNLPRFKTLDITVNILDCYKTSKAYGYCVAMDDKHRKFSIEIDKRLRLFDFVTSLCHELVHLKQYAKFEIEDVSLNKIKWKKTIFKDTIKYDDMPWEKEAYKLETKLAIECFKECL